jgi:hypothetical protein
MITGRGSKPLPTRVAGSQHKHSITLVTVGTSPKWTSFGQFGQFLRLLGRCLWVANFHEKALSVKGRRGGLLRWTSVTAFCALRAMLPFALLVSRLFSVARCIMGSVFSDYQEGAAIFASISPQRVGQVRMAQSPCARSEAHSDNRSRTPRSLSGTALSGSSPPLLPFGFAGSTPMFLLCRLASRAVGVSQWLVDLSAHPQTVHKHSELPRCGHHRSLL